MELQTTTINQPMELDPMVPMESVYQRVLMINWLVGAD